MRAKIHTKTRKPTPMTRVSGTTAVRWICLVLLTLAIRLPFVLHRRPTNDEDVYSVAANEILDGGRLYTEAAGRKPPLLFWTYAAIFPDRNVSYDCPVVERALRA